MEDTETSNLESKLIPHLIFVIEIIVIYKYNKFFKNMTEFTLNISCQMKFEQYVIKVWLILWT